MNGMAWMMKVEPLQNAKEKGLSQAPSSRLYIFYFSDQDHIESIGKANTIKEG